MPSRAPISACSRAPAHTHALAGVRIRARGSVRARAFPHARPAPSPALAPVHADARARAPTPVPFPHARRARVPLPVRSPARGPGASHSPQPLGPPLRPRADARRFGSSPELAAASPSFKRAHPRATTEPARVAEADRPPSGTSSRLQKTELTPPSPNDPAPTNGLPARKESPRLAHGCSVAPFLAVLSIFLSDFRLQVVSIRATAGPPPPPPPA